MKNKNTKKELRVVDGKLVQVEVTSKELEIRKEAIENATKRVPMTMSQHKAMSRKLTGPIYKTVPVITAVVLRAREEQGEAVLYTETFKTFGSNNPNAIALMGAAGDFNRKTIKEVQIAEWDEKEREVVQKYKVKCNDKSEDRVYYETETHCLVIYGALDKDLNKIYKKLSDEDKRAKKAEMVDKVANLGLVVTADNQYVIGGKDVKGNKLSVLYWSPSNTRNETQFMTRIAADMAFNILNKVSGGALKEAIQGKLTVEKLIKASARLGILGAPAVPMVESANDRFGYVIYMKKIQGPSDFSEKLSKDLEAAGMELDTNTYDGAFSISAEFIKAAFAYYGVKISRKKALAFAVQTRANKFFTKVFGETKSQKNMQHRLKKLIAMTPDDKILRVAAGTPVSNEDKDKYELIIVGNEECLGSIIDTNGGKLLDNISLQTIVSGGVMTYLLDMAKCSKTSTSGQMLQKFLTANRAATIEVIKNCLGRDLDTKLEHKIEGDINPHTCSLAEFVLRFAPDGKTNSAALEALIKDEIKRQDSIIKNLKVEIEAYFQRALFDDTYFLTGKKVNSLLGRNKWTGRLECYSRDIEEIYAEQIEAIESDESKSDEDKDKEIARLLTGVAFKYPSPSADENAILTYVTSKQLERRIQELFEAGIINEEEKEILEDDFLYTSYGVTKIGADNTLKHKLAGMDTDYDGIAVVFEKDLVQILLDKYPTTDGVATIICK